MSDGNQDDIPSSEDHEQSVWEQFLSGWERFKDMPGLWITTIVLGVIALVASVLLMCCFRSAAKEKEQIHVAKAKADVEHDHRNDL